MIIKDLFNFFQIIIPAIITAIVTIYITRLKYKEEKEKIITLTKEVKDLSQGFLIDLMTFNSIHHLVNELFNKTKASRFLILNAKNGTEEFRLATALYEQHNSATIEDSYISIGATGKFINFKLDDDYKLLLKNAEKFDKVRLITDEMKNSKLKRAYKTEKVKDSLVYFLKRVKIDDNNDRIFYCSIATHNTELFSEDDLTIIEIYIDQLQRLLDRIIS